MMTVNTTKSRNVAFKTYRSRRWARRRLKLDRLLLRQTWKVKVYLSVELESLEDLGRNADWHMHVTFIFNQDVKKILNCDTLDHTRLYYYYCYIVNPS